MKRSLWKKKQIEAGLRAKTEPNTDQTSAVILTHVANEYRGKSQGFSLDLVSSSEEAKAARKQRKKLALASAAAVRSMRHAAEHPSEDPENNEEEREVEE